VIPKPIREAAGLRPGAALEIRYREGRVEMEPQAADVKLVRKGKFVVARLPDAPQLTREQVTEAIHLVREERGGAR